MKLYQEHLGRPDFPCGLECFILLLLANHLHKNKQKKVLVYKTRGRRGLALPKNNSNMWFKFNGGYKNYDYACLQAVTTTRQITT